MNSPPDALSPPEPVTRGLLILARIIAREAINNRLASCAGVSAERRAEEEPPVVNAAAV